MKVGFKGVYLSRACFPDVLLLCIVTIKEQCRSVIRGMAEKFVDSISIFNRKGNSVKMNISGFAKTFHEQIDEIL